LRAEPDLPVARQPPPSHAVNLTAFPSFPPFLFLHPTDNGEVTEPDVETQPAPGTAAIHGTALALISFPTKVRLAIAQERLNPRLNSNLTNTGTNIYP
jgi:hypothetical protein